jgi:hypothetical protein
MSRVPRQRGLVKHEGKYRKDLEVGWDLQKRPLTFCGIKAVMYPLLGGGKRAVNGGGARAEYDKAHHASAFRTLGAFRNWTELWPCR